MTDAGADTDTETPNVTDAPVTLSLIGKLIDQHPAWRATSHTTPAGREVTMIEYADDQYEFMTGLPGAFISFIEREADDTDMDQAEAHDLEGRQGLPYLVTVRTDLTIVDTYGPVNALNTRDAVSKTVGPPESQPDKYSIDVYPIGISPDGRIERETYEGGDEGSP
jgi:hypothetical protein